MSQMKALVRVTSRQSLAQESEKCPADTAIGLRLGQCGARAGSRLSLRSLPTPLEDCFFGTGLRCGNGKQTAAPVTWAAMSPVGSTLRAALQCGVSATATGVRTHRCDA